MMSARERTILFLLPAITTIVAQQENRQTTSEEQVVVRPSQGPLMAWRPGGRKPFLLEAETRVAPPDRIGSYGGAYAAFAAEGDVFIALKGVEGGGDRGLALEKVEKKLVIKLYEGSLLLDTLAKDLTVKTPHGEVTAKEAYFLVEVTKKNAHVITIDGALTFSTSLGEVKLEAGQESKATKDAPPSKPQPVGQTRTLDSFALDEGQFNLIKNPGFEQGLNHWDAPPHEGRERTTVSDQAPHSGKSCARLEVSPRIYGSRAPDYYIGFNYRSIPVTPGRRYFARAYVRTETKTGTVTPRFVVALDSKEGVTWDCPTGKEWRLTRGFFTAKTKEVSLGILAGVSTDDFDCMIYLDDFFLCEIALAPGERR